MPLTSTARRTTATRHNGGHFRTRRKTLRHTHTHVRNNKPACTVRRAEEGELLRRPSAVVIIKLIICLRVPRGNYNSDFGHLPDVDAVAIAFADCDADADANEDANVDDDDVHE